MYELELQQRQVEPSSSVKPPGRSRYGCQRCRRLHHKCDEAKPTCGKCQSQGWVCSYQKALSWGGRPFNKSSFGEYLNAGVVAVAVMSGSKTESTSFVYGLQRPLPSGAKSKTIDLAEAINPKRVVVTSTPAQGIARNPDNFSWLPPAYRSLIHYFTEIVTRSFTLHEASHSGFCSTFIPMALQSVYGQQLLPAVLSVSAAHQNSRGVGPSHQQSNFLRYKSVEKFKIPVIGNDMLADDVALATALMLCLYEIISGGQRPQSWRMHLQGASAILHQVCATTKDQNSGTETHKRATLRRWCVSLEVLALLCETPLPVSDVAALIEIARPDGLHDYIDEFHGFSTKLVPIFGEINILVANKMSLQMQTSPLGEELCFIEERCWTLIHLVHVMIGDGTQEFHPSIQASILPTARSSFVLLDSAYHHVALLQCYVRILGLPPSAVLVRTSVEKIIECISGLNIRHESCPAVAILQPVFTAGCEACGSWNRGRIINWLDTLEDYYHMGNVKHAKAFLKDLWAERDSQSSQAANIRWDCFMKEKEWELSLY